jgi:hypothetical protein
MLTLRITARSIWADDIIIRSGMLYRAVDDAVEQNDDTVTVTVMVVRGAGISFLAGRIETITFGDMDPVDIMRGGN